MTYLQLKAALEAICDAVYELEAPAGATRFVVISCYGADTLIADDAVQMEALKVQIDVCWQSDGDALLSDVKTALSGLYIPYSVQDVAYDDDYMAMRAILQCEGL